MHAHSSLCCVSSPVWLRHERPCTPQAQPRRCSRLLEVPGSGCEPSILLGDQGRRPGATGSLQAPRPAPSGRPACSRGLATPSTPLSSRRAAIRAPGCRAGAPPTATRKRRTRRRWTTTGKLSGCSPARNSALRRAQGCRRLPAATAAQALVRLKRALAAARSTVAGCSLLQGR